MTNTLREPTQVGAGAVAFRGVTKRFGNVTAVGGGGGGGAPGEFLVVVGPSGCGKTTALRMVAGLEEPSDGQIHIGGVDVTRVNGRDRDLAMVFQSYALYPHLSVRDNIAFGLRQRRADRTVITDRLAQVATMLELGSLLDRKPAQLSGGQRQRVALARAVARQTDVLLMDEPLSNLDAQLRNRARIELAELHQRLGTTILYVTHDQVEAMTLGQRIAVMNAGTLQQCATPREVYERPANTFVASFIGSPSMNLLTAHLRHTGATTFLGIGTYETPLPPTAVAAVRLRSDHERMVLGVRAEQFESVPTAAGTGDLDGQVQVIEPLGSDQFVTVALADGQRVTARLRPEVSVRRGDRIGLRIGLAGCHLFDAETGIRSHTFAKAL